MDEREQQISRLEEETIERERKYGETIKKNKLKNEQEMETLKACVRDYEAEITNLKHQWESSMNFELEEEQEKWNRIVGELRDNLRQKDAAMDDREKELLGQKEAGLSAVSKELTCRVVQLSMLEVEVEEMHTTESEQDADTERQEITDLKVLCVHVLHGEEHL